MNKGLEEIKDKLVKKPNSEIKTRILKDLKKKSKYETIEK